MMVAGTVSFLFFYIIIIFGVYFMGTDYDWFWKLCVCFRTT